LANALASSVLPTPAFDEHGLAELGGEKGDEGGGFAGEVADLAQAVGDLSNR
jgi:hypothetical protein